MAKEIDQSRYSINEGESLYDGANSSINEVEFSLGKHKVPLLKKKYKGPYEPEFMEGPQWHTILKEKGYPVLPTWRYDKDEKTDFITDLRRGGTHRVIDFCAHPDGNKNIFVSNLDELEDEAEALVSKLADDGVIIVEPNIFFDVDISTGVAKIILGDLREMWHKSQNEANLDVTRDQIFDHDRKILDGHLSRLKANMIEKTE